MKFASQKISGKNLVAYRSKVEDKRRHWWEYSRQIQRCMLNFVNLVRLNPLKIVMETNAYAKNYEVIHQ